MPPAPRAEQPLISVLISSPQSLDSLELALECFERQDYAERELIVIDDPEREWMRRLPVPNRVRVVQLPRAVPAAVRRDYAVQICAGELAVFWDDAACSLPGRLSEQSAPLRDGAAQAAELVSGLYYQAGAGSWFRRSGEPPATFSLLFRRTSWSAGADPLAGLFASGSITRLPAEHLYFRVVTASPIVDGSWQAVEPPPALVAWQQRWGVRLAQRRPLVSCIMPTAGRRELAAHAVRQFLEQSYENKELIVVDAGREPLGPALPNDDRVHCVRTAPGQTTGALRNIGCAQARGEIIVHWDDDDWMADWRLSYQVAEMMSANADLCGLDQLYFVDPLADRAWLYRYPDGEPAWVAGGTLCYRREVWERQPFADLRVGEDNHFVWSGAARHVLRLADKRFYVATVHAGNTSPKQTDNDRWLVQPVSSVQQIVGADWPALSRLFAASAGAPPRPVRANIAPLVSCVLATRNRPEFVRQLIRCFLRQSWQRTELIVVDDGEPSVAGLCEGLGDVRHLPCPHAMSLGAKLNLGIEQARGEVIQKLDDDDYYGPQFLSEAVSALWPTPPASAIVAWCCFLVLLPGGRRPRFSGHGWAAGASLSFDRALWERTKFRDLPSAVDQHFLNDAGAEVVRVCKPQSLMVVRHGRHTWSHLQDRTSVEDYFRRQPEHPASVLEIVEPIDAPFYRRLTSVADEH